MFLLSRRSIEKNTLKKLYELRTLNSPQTPLCANILGIINFITVDLKDFLFFSLEEIKQEVEIVVNSDWVINDVYLVENLCWNLKDSNDWVECGWKSIWNVSVVCLSSQPKLIFMVWKNIPTSFNIFTHDYIDFKRIKR